LGLLPLDGVRVGLVEKHPYTTGAYLFLWARERRRDLRVADPSASWDDAAAYMAREGFARRDGKVMESEAAKPLDDGPNGDA
jgi:hypothetical protein